MAKKETAEQKLLKIIESQGGEDAKKQQPAQEGQATSAAPVAEGQPVPTQNVAEETALAVKGTGLPQTTLPPFLRTLLGSLKGRGPAAASVLTFGLHEVNNILMGVTVLVAILLATNLIQDMQFAKRKITITVDSALTQATDVPAFLLKGVEVYLERISRRSIFQPYEKKEVEEELVETDMKPITVLAKDFKLVGISWLDSPETASAMIEDTVSGITHFLKVGEKIKDVAVKNIFVDRIILMYEGEELTLEL